MYRRNSIVGSCQSGSSKSARLLCKITKANTCRGCFTIFFCSPWSSRTIYKRFYEIHIEGFISDKALGDNGFGWDPIFIPEGFDKTFAEITDAEKNKCSMRAMALNEFNSWLQTPNI
ncbi:non-canonical purine NTP pyrophosphatase [Candidatus Amesbacteria bacterium]|nr:non-canonical purine NTP pyrophosphatase [Candidatus Amesbacteria bacterium]